MCEFTIEESLEYYRSLQKNGIINVEMESIAFAAFTRRAGIKSAIITVILNDLLQTNQVINGFFIFLCLFRELLP